jgi:hypothetical protein
LPSTRAVSNFPKVLLSEFVIAAAGSTWIVATTSRIAAAPTGVAPAASRIAASATATATKIPPRICPKTSFDPEK